MVIKMKKLNNKGFAISTVIYSLLLMAILIITLLMSIMSNNRTNNSGLVKTIEEELNRYSETATDFTTPADTTKGQEYIVPQGQSGWYKIELWGASGANSTSGGSGAYTSGTIYLTENDHLYFFIGKQGNGRTGGYNGGGTSGTSSTAGYGGGGATDVRLTNASYNDAGSLRSRIMVAAGGGGSNANTDKGGDGGTLIGLNGSGDNPGYGGGQSTGGKRVTNSLCGSGENQYCGAKIGVFGAGGSGNWSGEVLGSGGSGYYGGSSAGGLNNNGSGGGGSSYISGYAGVMSVKSASDSTAEAKTKHYSGKYFVNGLMVPGVNVGDGRARIYKVSDNDQSNPPGKKNTSLDNVRYIKDCITKNTINDSSHWVEVQAISNGENIAKGKTVTRGNTVNAAWGTQSAVTDGKIETASPNSGSTWGFVSADDATTNCVTVDLGSVNKLDEIAVWHYFEDGRTYYQNTLSVSSDNSTWVAIKPDLINTQRKETSTGYHFSSWQTTPSTDDVVAGQYYIFSAGSPKRVFTADSSLVSTDATKTELFQKVELGDRYNLQKWQVQKVGTAYNIIETDNKRYLQMSENEARDGINVITSTGDSAYPWTQWVFEKVGNGEYYIHTATKDVDGNYKYIMVNSANELVLGSKTENLNQMFTLINSEF